MEALLKIQQELNAPKGQFNKFGGYKYRSCEDIVEAVKPLLKKYEAVLTLDDDLVLIGDRYYIKATATLYLKGSSPVSVHAFAREEESKKGMDQAMVTGSSSSYARKYALCGLFAIDDGVDPDSTNKGDAEKPAEKKSDDDKPWFNDGDLDKFTKFATSYGDAEGGLKIIRTKYRISKAMEQKVRDLYVSLDTIGS